MCERCEVAEGIPTKSTRWRLWELAGHLHCAILGTCLTLADIRRVGHQLVRQRKLNFPPDLPDHQLHGFFVTLAGSRHPAGKVLSRLLDTRHRKTVARFGVAKTPKQLHVLWNEAVKAGQIPGACWAMMSHPNVTEDLRAIIMGEIHMMSHLSGAAQNAEARALHRLASEASALELHVLKLEDSTELAQANADALRLILAKSEAAFEHEKSLRIALEAQTEAHELRQQVADLQEHLAHLSALEIRARKAEAIVQVQSETLGALQTQLAHQRSETASLEQLIAQSVSDIPVETDRCGGCETPCNNPNLLGKRVLYVGGHTNLSGHYRRVVELLGGEFVYHDGGQERRLGRLDAVLPNVHLVVCPVSAVSHGACLRAKYYCKKNAKQFMPLRGPGVASLARALTDTTAVRR